MRFWSPFFLAGPALALVALSAAPASTQPRRPKTETLFISPAGQPFRADPGQPYPVAVWFAQADANHDGQLTREEFRADFVAFFKQLDTDHNGVVDGIEIAAYEQDVAPEVLPRLAQTEAGDFPANAGDEGLKRRATRRLAQAPARKGELAIDGAPEFSFLNVAEPVANADQNFDGKISLDEFLAAADRRFDLLDPDHNGVLTLDTLPQTPDQIAVEGKRKKR